MRLTLRTLLAYMDDVLDPADHEELSHKIEASEFATELIHRTRDAVRRLRLGAPDVHAGEDGDLHSDGGTEDANVVAEYLDSTVEPERVAEFERRCLEAGTQADMQLAEVASCHHILTMVLGEPAYVDEDLRQRLYRMSPQASAATQHRQRVESAHVAPELGVSPPTESEEQSSARVAPSPRESSPSPAHPVVPSYLIEARRQQRRKRRWIAAAVLGSLLGAATVFVMRPGQPPSIPPELSSEELAQVDPGETFATTPATRNAPAVGAGSDADDARPVAGGDASVAGDGTSHPGDGTSTPKGNEARVAMDPTTSNERDDDGLEGEEPGDLRGEADDGDFGTTQDVAAAQPAGSPVGSANAETTALDGPPGDGPLPHFEGIDAGSVAGSSTASGDPGVPGAETLSTTLPAADDLPAAAELAEAMSESTRPAADAPSADRATGDASSANVLGLLTPPVGVSPPLGEGVDGTPEATPQQIGRYLGNEDVVLRFSSKRNSWERLPANTPLFVGDRLMALPTFRAHVVLGDANVYLSGCELELLGGGDGALQLGVEYGRLVVNAGLNGNRLAIRAEEVERELALDPSSSLAFEVRRLFQAGAGRASAPLEISWFLTSGSCQIEPSGPETQAPSVWQTEAGIDLASAALDRLPPWVHGEGVTLLDAAAQRTVAEALLPGESVNIRLLELSENRKVEVRTLAAQCTASAGLFEPLVKSFNDPTLQNIRGAWDRHVEVIRQAMARNPASVDAVYEALSAHRGQQAADDLLQMLIGYDDQAIGATREEIQRGALSQLIDWLESDQLDYRVLAIYNLNAITGTNNLGAYRPTKSPEDRRRAAERYYRQRLEKGELIPRKK